MRAFKLARDKIWPTCLLVLASISVALYYNITFFGKAVVALPSFPVAAGCLFYYLSAFNTKPPVAQVLLWIGSFLVSGWLWWWVLGRLWSSKWASGAALSTACGARLKIVLGVYLVPLPWLLWVHAQSANGPSLEALRASILVRDGLYWSSQGSEVFLNGLFLVLASVETVITVAILARTEGGHAAKAMGAVSLAGLGSMAILCALSELAVRL